jgi:hypothetical protein
MVDLRQCTISRSNGTKWWVEVNGRRWPLKIHGAKYKEILCDRRFGAQIFAHIINTGAEDLPYSAYFDRRHQDYRVQEKTLFKPIRVAHDPSPNKEFVILTYDSLTSVHWHILCHVIIDSYHGQIPTFRINDTPVTEKWEIFRDQVNCHRYSNLDENNLYDSFNKRKQDYVGIAGRYQPHGCMNCYQNDEELRTFLKCCDFFKQERTDYLKRIRDLIIYQIQDAQHTPYYQNQRTVTNAGDLIVPKRRHLHVSDDRQNYIYDYVFFSSPNLADTVGTFKLTLKRENNRNTYRIKTFFGESYNDKVVNAMYSIHKRMINRPNRPVNYKCSQGFWGAHPQFHDPVSI